MDRLTLKNLSLASAVAMALGIPLDSSAAGYLKIGDIKGEATDQDHKDWINVLSWSWGLSASDRGKTCVQDMQLSKILDSASGDLAQSIPAGTMFPEAQLALTAQYAGGSQFEYQTYTMKNVRVSSFNSSGSDGGGIPGESISISFGELVGTYTNPEDGTSQTFIIPASDCK